MKILLTILFLILIVSSVNAERVRIWYKPDKTVETMSCPQGLNWNSCMVAALQANPKLMIYGYEDMDSSNLPSEEYRRAWRGEKGKGVWVEEKELLNLETQRYRKVLDKKEEQRQKRISRIKRLKEEGLLAPDYPEE